jgi:hypothetical protein
MKTINTVILVLAIAIAATVAALAVVWGIGSIRPKYEVRFLMKNTEATSESGDAPFTIEVNGENLSLDKIQSLDITTKFKRNEKITIKAISNFGFDYLDATFVNKDGVDQNLVNEAKGDGYTGGYELEFSFTITGNRTLNLDYTKTAFGLTYVDGQSVVNEDVYLNQTLKTPSLDQVSSSEKHVAWSYVDKDGETQFVGAGSNWQVNENDLTTTDDVNYEVQMNAEYGNLKYQYKIDKDVNGTDADKEEEINADIFDGVKIGEAVDNAFIENLDTIAIADISKNGYSRVFENFSVDNSKVELTEENKTVFTFDNLVNETGTKNYTLTLDTDWTEFQANKGTIKFVTAFNNPSNSVTEGGLAINGNHESVSAETQTDANLTDLLPLEFGVSATHDEAELEAWYVKGDKEKDDKHILIIDDFKFEGGLSDIFVNELVEAFNNDYNKGFETLPTGLTKADFTFVKASEAIAYFASNNEERTLTSIWMGWTK